jgi:hypothetical protein
MWRGTLAVLLAVGALASPAASGDAGSESARSFPKSFTGLITRHLDRTFDGGGDVEDWTVKITLRRKQITARGAWYEGSALAEGKMNGTFRTCVYGFGPEKRSVTGTLLIENTRESPTGLTYDLRGGGGPWRVPFRERCDTPGQPRPTIQVGFTWDSSSPSPTYRGPRIEGRIEGRQEGNHGVVTWNLMGQGDEESCDELRARASRATALRASRVTLDGSASGPRKCIRAYRWSFDAGDNCHGAALQESTKTGPTPTIVPLCSVEATLTVIGEKGRRATTSARVRVRPRTDGFTTPDVEHEEIRVDDPRINDPPFAHPGEDYGDRNGGIILGLNVSACRQGSRGPPFLCPDVGSGSGLGKRYTLATVQDPGGPFDGFVYVATAPITIERVGILNHWFLPGGPIVAPGQPSFYEYNRTHPIDGAPVDVAGFVAAAAAHEGMGENGQLASGHSGRLQAYVSVPNRDSDPRRTVESRFGKGRNALRDEIDRELTSLSAQLFTATRDPLPEIWSGKLWLYDPEVGSWVQDAWAIGPSDTH